MAAGALALVAAGCDGGDDEGDDAEKGPPEPTQAEMKAAVRFVNEDRVVHTVATTSGRGKDFSGRLKPGDLYLADPEAHGTFEYRCTIHEGMTGRIVVRK